VVEATATQKGQNGQTRPSFSELIAFQSAEGLWQENALLSLKVFFKKDLISKLSPKLLCTVAALLVLEEFFADREKEWTLMRRKARNCLKQAGLNSGEEIQKLRDLL
jgi:hypothetical protein